MRLNGWTRIAVVLSAVWMVGGTVFYWDKEARRNSDAAIAWSNERHKCIGENGERRYRGERERECPTQEFVDSFWKNNNNDLWIAAIIPAFWLVVAWVLGGITVLSVWWIRRGFRPSNIR